MSSMRWHISYSLRETTDLIACIVTSLKSRAVCTNSENAIGILLNDVPKSLFFYRKVLTKLYSLCIMDVYSKFRINSSDKAS